MQVCSNYTRLEKNCNRKRAWVGSVDQVPADSKVIGSLPFRAIVQEARPTIFSLFQVSEYSCERPVTSVNELILLTLYTDPSSVNDHTWKC